MFNFTKISSRRHRAQCPAVHPQSRSPPLAWPLPVLTPPLLPAEEELLTSPVPPTHQPLPGFALHLLPPSPHHLAAPHPVLCLTGQHSSNPGASPHPPAPLAPGCGTVLQPRSREQSRGSVSSPQGSVSPSATPSLGSSLCSQNFPVYPV